MKWFPHPKREEKSNTRPKIHNFPASSVIFYYIFIEIRVFVLEFNFSKDKIGLKIHEISLLKAV